MNRLTKLSIAVGAAMCAGTAVADVPQEVLGNDYDQYTVDAAGNIQLNNAGGTFGCPIGASCTVLEATGPGILQQKVAYSGDGTFYQTIIVADGAASIADPNDLGFRMENYVDASNNATNFATMSVVKGGTAGFDEFTTEFENQEGVLRGADASNPTGLQSTETIHQVNEVLGGFGSPRVAEFFFEDEGPGGKRLALNFELPTNEGVFTLRRASGTFVDVGGTIALDQGDFITYAAGAALNIVDFSIAASGNGAQYDRVFAKTIVQELADGQGGGAAIQEIMQDNIDHNTGMATVTGGAAGTQLVGAGPFVASGWTTNLFGAEPLTYDSDGAGGVQAPAGGFFPPAPPWNTIVP